MKITKLLLTVPLFLSLSCSQQAKNEAQDVQEEMKELVNVTGQDIKDEMTSMEVNMEILRKELDQKIKKLDEAASTASVEMKKDIDRQLKQLKGYREKLSVKAENLGENIKTNFSSFQKEVYESMKETEKWIQEHQK